MSDGNPTDPESSANPGSGRGSVPAAGVAVDDGSGTASSTTANLPAIGGPDDPYLDRSARASNGSKAALAASPVRPSSAPPLSAVAPSAVAPGPAPVDGSAAATAAAPAPPAGSNSPFQRPSRPNAVDQYAALGLAPGATSASPVLAVGSVATADAPSSVPLAPSIPAVPPPGNAPAGPAVARVARPARRVRSERTPRRARLQVRHFNVWTVFKFSVVLAVALFFVWMIVVAVVYGLLDHLKVIDKINKTVQTIENNSSDTSQAVTPRVVFTSAFLIGLVDIVLFIVLTTIGSVVYNLCADLVGGIEVTLAERD